MLTLTSDDESNIWLPSGWSSSAGEAPAMPTALQAYEANGRIMVVRVIIRRLFMQNYWALNGYLHFAAWNHVVF